jgi:hypothetical protein
VIAIDRQPNLCKFFILSTLHNFFDRSNSNDCYNRKLANYDRLASSSTKNGRLG